MPVAPRRPRPLRLWVFEIAGVAMLACALTATALGPTAAPAAAANGRHRLILSPRAGQTVPARMLTIRVRARHRGGVFGVWLNGHPIGPQFSPVSHRGVRSLQASLCHGLLHGRNRLRVRVRRQTQRVVFRVRRTRHLVCAGLDRTVTLGGTVLLRGRHRLPPAANRPRSRAAASAKARGGGAKYRWRTISGPVPDTAGGPTGATDQPQGHGRWATFAPTIPGRYRLRLRVTTSDGTSASDFVVATVRNPPLVTVDTMMESSGGQPGIKVGDQSYYANDSVNRPWFQVLVLDHRTLTLTSNTTYSCKPAADGFCGNDQMFKDLDNLDDRSLVIVANHMGDPKWVAPGYVPFGKIGARDYEPRDLPKDGAASFSAIGVPDTKPGEGNWHLDPARGSGGRMEGSLIKDNVPEYTYLAPRTTFDTQVYGSDTSQNVMQLGAKKLTQALPLDANLNGRGGFHVLVIDRMSLDVQSSWFPTGLQNNDSGEAGRLNAMSSKLDQANSGDNIVIIASRGNPAIQGGREDQQQNVNNAAQRLVDAIQALGGTRTAAFQALAAPPAAKSGASYTLIGHSRAGAAHGVEAQGQSTTAAKALNDAALRGTLRRGNDYSFDVATSAPSEIQNPSDPPQHVAGQKLNDTLVQAPTPWPEQDPKVFPDAAERTRKQNAVSYIGKRAFAGNDVRTYYWTSGRTDAWWQGKQTDVAKVSYPALAPLGFGFNSADLDWAKGEIKKEITWLLAVRDFTTGLAEPFAKEGLQSWADLGSVAANVNDVVKPAGNDPALAIANGLFNGAREAASTLAGLIPEVGPILGPAVAAANKAYDAALEIAKIASEGNKPAGQPFPVKAANYGKELVTRLNTAHDTLTDEMTDAIVADYGKLKTVGACDKLSAACPGNAQAWEFDEKDQRAAAIALRYGTEIADYGALVPARWTLWQLGPMCEGSTGYTCWETDFANNGFWGPVGTLNAAVCPFLDEPRSAKLIRPLYRDIPHYHNNAHFGGKLFDIWQAYALGNISGGGVAFNPYKMELPGDSLKRLFAPVDPDGNPEKGGLGAQPEAFFLGYMTPKLMYSSKGGGQAYPYKDSETSWWGSREHCVRW